MLKNFQGIRKNFRIRPPRYIIDNWIFRLHYRLTSLFYLVATVLVTSREYIGEHIRCVSDTGVPERIMDRFCFFMSTFTVIKHLDSKSVDKEYLAAPGVGPIGINSDDPIKRHAYYQWVPFLLFGQAIMFYAPHFIWKMHEGRKLRRLVEGLRLAAFSLEDKEIQVRDDMIPSRGERDNRINLIRRAFMERIYIGRSWSQGLIICEVLNLVNTALQIYFTNIFLGGQFLYLGVDILKRGYEESVDPLEIVFPKVTKCTFHKYGPSGSLQAHDAMCVMALNIINEKIYTFFWFWLLILLILSILGLFWRILTVCLHARSQKFNEIVFAHVCPGKLNPWKVLTVTNHCSYSDWLFLRYMSKNIDGLLFRELFISLAEDLYETSVGKYVESKRPTDAELGDKSE